MTIRCDVAVVGAGILGLAHAWRAAVRGLRVIVLERSPAACGASVRNFGMIWPIGQPTKQLTEPSIDESDDCDTDDLFKTALQSRELWLQLARAAGLWVNPCGSLHLAHRDDEFSVLEEFCESTSSPAGIELLAPAEVSARSPATVTDGLRGAMWSPHELCVNPREVIRDLPGWLQRELKVEFHFDYEVQGIDGTKCITSSTMKQNVEAEQIIVCGGADFRSLFPDEFVAAGLKTCKLQMLRTVSQPKGWQIGCHLASGLTLRHYASFRHCPSLARLQQRVQDETPELNRFGIHVMAAQDNEGHVVLGDSHEYDHEISPFDKSEIDRLILRELKKQFSIPDWTIDQRWHGLYIKHPEQTLLTLTPQENVTVFCSPGGAGMTLSMGWAESFWNGHELDSPSLTKPVHSKNR